MVDVTDDNGGGLTSPHPEKLSRKTFSARGGLRAAFFIASLLKVHDRSSISTFVTDAERGGLLGSVSRHSFKNHSVRNSTFFYASVYNGGQHDWRLA